MVSRNEKTVNVKPGWWPATEAAHPPLYLTHSVRRDYCLAALWAVQHSVEEVRERHLTDRGMSAGERLAIYVANLATYCLPTGQTADEWLRAVGKWNAPRGHAVSHDLPPTPWDADAGPIADIFRSMAMDAARLRLSHQGQEDHILWSAESELEE